MRKKRGLKKPQYVNEGRPYTGNTIESVTPGLGAGGAPTTTPTSQVEADRLSLQSQGAPRKGSLPMFNKRGVSAGGFKGSNKPQSPDQDSVTKAAIKKRVDRGPLAMEKDEAKQKARANYSPPKAANSSLFNTAKSSLNKFGETNRRRKGYAGFRG